MLELSFIIDYKLYFYVCVFIYICECECVCVYTHMQIYIIPGVEESCYVYVYQDTFFKMEKGATLHISTLLTSSTYPKS